MSNIAFMLFYYGIGAAFGYNYVKSISTSKKDGLLGVLALMNLWVFTLLTRIYLYSKEEKWAFYAPDGDSR